MPGGLLATQLFCGGTACWRRFCRVWHTGALGGSALVVLSMYPRLPLRRARVLVASSVVR